MHAHFENDWRSQLDSKYNEPEYDDFLPSSKFSKSLESTQDSKYEELDEQNKQFDAIRFPPYSKIDLPESLFSDDYLDHIEEYDPKRNSINSNDSVAGLDFLEALFQTVVGKAVDIRNSIIEHGKYIYFLNNPPTAAETEHMKSTISENLILLRDESLQLIKEMVIFQTDKVNDMIHQDIQSGKDLIIRRKASLFQRSAEIKHEVTESAIVVDSLIHFSNSLINYPTEPVCRVDGIHVDWTKLSKLQMKVLASNRSVKFSAHMVARGLPVCNEIYCYLQSTKSYANLLQIVDYSFLAGEFAAVLDFLDLQHTACEKRNSRPAEVLLDSHSVTSVFQSIHQLVICNCEITDRDCHLLSVRLSKMPLIHTLSLRNNKLTCSGATSIATAVFEGSVLKLRCLRLDGNRIKMDGITAIADVLDRLPFLETLSLSGNPIGDLGLHCLLKKCMNPLRKAFKSLPRPTRKSTLGSGGSVASELGSVVEVDGDEGEDNAAESVDHLATLLSGGAYGETCYFQDFFAPDKLSSAQQSSDMMRFMFGSSENKDGRGKDGGGWLNSEEDEFAMDGMSEYSEEGADEEQEETVVKREVEAEKMLSQAELRKTYPKIVQSLLRVRLKLVAVSALLQLRSKGAALSSLSVANCKLTSAVAETIAHALLDDRNITSLDVSQNEKLLSEVGACNAFASLLERGDVATLKLSGCGVNDYCVMVLTKRAMTGTALRSLDLSENYIGSTGANWIATASKVFYCDKLQFRGGFHKTAPFLKVHASGTGNAQHDHQYIDEFDDEVKSERGGQLGRKGRYYTDTLLGSEEDEPYQDTDVYDGEEERSADEEAGSEYDHDGYYQDNDNDDSTYAETRASSIRAANRGRGASEEQEEEVSVAVKKKRFNVL